MKGELSAQLRLEGFSQKGWARIEIGGEDSEIFAELVARRLGSAKTDLSQIEKHDTLNGIVTGLSSSALQVDLGIESPTAINVEVGLNQLRAQLADGRRLSVREIAENYCLFPGCRVIVGISSLQLDTQVIGGMLADAQIDLFRDWITSGLERVLVFGCLGKHLEFAVRKANLTRDLVSTEWLTLTTHSLMCKLGTNAVGLIPKLGKILRKSQLEPFIPKRIIETCREW